MMSITQNKGMFSSNTDLWATPQDFFDTLDKEFHFNLDPCATAENAKCERYYTCEENGLSKNWGGIRYSAIRPTERKFQNGCVKLMKNLKNLEHSLLCFFPQGPTRLIFTIISIIRRRFALYAEGSNLEKVNVALHFLRW
jgi:hypothetical protein